MDSLQREDVEWMSPEGIIEYLAEEDGAAVGLALAIADAESNFNPNAKNPKSTASGLFQYIDSTWEDYCEGEKLNAYDSANCATQMLSEGGEHHWNASRRAWAHAYNS